MIVSFYNSLLQISRFLTDCKTEATILTKTRVNFGVFLLNPFFELDYLKIQRFDDFLKLTIVH